jgi:FkbM family methyltransferase
MKKTIVYIAPHLSTGGLPQYLFKQIESLLDEFEVYCIEWDNVTGGVLVIQRNRILNILGNRLITLSQNKHDLFDIIRTIQPDVIHLQEIPELFMPTDVADKLYAMDREYIIIETSHDSGYNVNNKQYLPDKFLMVSAFQANMYQQLGVPVDVVEYPIENKVRTKTREQALLDLGLDPNLKHVINVGLFTPRKNQAEVLEYARLLKNYPIQFHFIGNQADNFKFYWEPLMQNFPENCKWWNERNDVDAFYEAADLFLFTSRGNETDRETMPLVIRESLSWKVPSLIYNLPVYMGYFDAYDSIEYLTEDLQQNAHAIAQKLFKGEADVTKLSELDVDSFFDIEFIRGENKIIFNYKRQENFHTKVSIKDNDSNAPMYWFDTTFWSESSYWAIPLPVEAFDLTNDPSFSTLLLEFYNPTTNTLQFSKTIYVKDAIKKRTVRLDLQNPFDCLFNNYNEMFVEKKYDCYGLNNLDTVLDIGANNGLFSLLMLHSGCKKLYAFEPNTDSLINLRHQFKNNDNVTIIEKAVYTTDENLEFFIDPNNTTVGSLSEHHLLSNGTSVQKVIVPAISLKTFMQQYNVSTISLVKMDIEGAEYQIIEDLDDDTYSKIESFLIEYHDNTDNRISKMIHKLKSKGYDITQIRNQNSKNNDLITHSYETSPIGTLLAKRSPAEKLVTVVIPAYNHENYIKQAVDSVLKQKTLFNFSIVISDDCSSDRTYEIAQEYKDIPNVFVHRTEQNEGPTPRRIHNLLKRIKSDYVTFLDADDYYIDEYKLQKQVDFLENNPEYSVHSAGWIVAAEDSVAYGFDGTQVINMFSLKGDLTLEENCVDSNYVGFGFMIRNKHIVNRQFPDWYFGEDVFCGYWALNNIMLEYGKAKNEEWLGGRYRITPNGHFGEKTEAWKVEQTKKQLNVLKRAYGPPIKPILIVDAFFHDDYCLDTFKSYLSFIKKLDIPIMLVTNSNFDTSLIDEVDYVLYDSNNRFFEHKYKDIGSFVLYWIGEQHYISHGAPALQKHGLSVLSNLYHSTNLAKSLGFTHFYRIEYDCFIEKIENVKNIIDTVAQQNKKGLIYAKENRYVSFQIWYFELDYFTKYFPKINNEDDYRRAKEAFNSEQDFISAEAFVYNMVKISDGGFSNLIVRGSEEMHLDYGNCSWNTVTSPCESDKIVDGCVSSICRITIEDEEIRSTRHMPRPDWTHSPESCETNMSKVAFITWNLGSSSTNSAVAKFTYPNGAVKILEQTVSGIGANRVDIIDVIDGGINVEISVNNRPATHHVINKNTVDKLTDVYQPRIPV